MDSAFTAVLAEYEARMAAERGSEPGVSRPEDDLLLAVGQDAATLLNLLARSIKAKRILEIGTSYGYSTLWFAEAARQTGGKVITLELVSYKQDYARAALARAGLADVVEFRLGDAVETIRALEGPFDLVLIDLWKDLYIPCLDLVYPKLAPGALIAADNMLVPASNRANATDYRAAVRAKADITSVLLPVGHGIELSRYVGGLPPELA
jgi:predicted O-methyltransferase YrrM